MKYIMLSYPDHLRELNEWRLRLALLYSAFDTALSDCFASSSPLSYSDLLQVLMEDFERHLDSCPLGVVESPLPDYSP